MRKGHGVNLLVFVDCLVVLDILSKWGRTDFYPDPREVVHFDVIRHLFTELRQWSGNLTLVKIKSHTGCLNYVFIHPAAPHGATKLVCPRRKGAGPPLSHQGGEA
jgi:hypothetical protein